MPPLINIAPIVISMITAFGIFLHDTHIDKATTTAMALPLVAASVSAAHISSNDHTHVERTSLPRHMAPLRSSLPKMQPPRDDVRKYVLNKKLTLSAGGDYNYMWPSV